MWSYVVSTFTKPHIVDLVAQGTLAWCPDLDQWPMLLYADHAFLSSRTMMAPWSVAAISYTAHWNSCPFSASSSETMSNFGDARPVQMDDGRAFGNKASIKVF